MSNNPIPGSGNIEKFSIPRMEKQLFPNGMEFYFKKTDAEGLLRLDLMLPAGIQHQSRPLLAALTNSLLREGSRSMLSSQIAERFDYYGAFVYYSCGLEYAFINLCTPKKFFAQTLSILNEILRYPLFPQKELDTVLEQKRQRYHIDREKVQILAANEMNQCLFGVEHPYGKQLRDEDFDPFDSTLLRDFHSKHYHAAQSIALLSGELDEDDCKLLEQVLGTDPWGAAPSEVFQEVPRRPSEQKRFFIPKAGSLQAALRFSRPVQLDKFADNFKALKFLNTIFGGYFGSRLMRTLREEKGYTYGISSSLTVHKRLSYLDIRTQTDLKYADALTQGVYQEMKKLQDQLVPDEEMRLVRNYLKGEFARMLDGPFSLADVYIFSCSQGIDVHFYEQQMEVVQYIQAKEVQALAQRYFKAEDFYEVRAGGNNKPSETLVKQAADSLPKEE